MLPRAGDGAGLRNGLHQTSLGWCSGHGQRNILCSKPDRKAFLGEKSLVISSDLTEGVIHLRRSINGSRL